jgi:hypothetical protein
MRPASGDTERKNRLRGIHDIPVLTADHPLTFW